MGNIEKEGRKRAKRGYLRKLILEAVLTAGELNAIFVRSRVNAALEIAQEPLYPRRNEIINRACRHLVASGHLRQHDGGYSLTQKGEIELRALTAHEVKVAKPRRWDGKWRILVFDIPEERKALREKIRRSLVAIGFHMLQKSVWIFPYDCEDFIALLKADLEVGGHMLYVIADALESDHGYRDAFALPLDK